MRLVWKVFRMFLLILGAIFLVLIIGGVWFYVEDPYNIRPLVSGFFAPVNATPPMKMQPPQEYTDNPKLSTQQNEALKDAGIDPSRNISKEQEACMLEALGEARVRELGAGADPTIADALKIRGCI